MDIPSNLPAFWANVAFLPPQRCDALMLVAPSDHAIADAQAFRATIWLGAAAARAGRIVTFGITPSWPETAYGWLELSDETAAAVPLKRFVEKPDSESAEAMLAAGTFLWNAGIFLFTARTIIASFMTGAHRPWGWFETLALSDRFQVKRIVVKPNASLSLQSHVRQQLWHPSFAVVRNMIRF